MTDLEKKNAIEMQLTDRYKNITLVDFVSCIEQTWGMQGDEWNVRVILNGERKIWMLYAKESNKNYILTSQFDLTELKYCSYVKASEIISVPKIFSGGSAVSGISVLDKWQLERLCCIVYLNNILHGTKPGKEKMTDLMPDLEEEINSGNDLPIEMTEKEWKNVLDSIKEDMALMELNIIHIQDITEPTNGVLEGQRAVTFASSDNQNIYLIYRGTHGNLEWLDNAYGMIESDTYQQAAALQYLNFVKEEFPHKYLAVAGHSKGGNKAQYVTLVSEEGIVDYGMSLDGQGFSEAFLKKYASNIKLRKNLCRLAEQRDFVNCLGLYLEYSPQCAAPPTEFYRGFRGYMGADQNNIFGYPLPLFHCPDALRTEKGTILLPNGTGHISSLIADIMSDFLTQKIFNRNEKKKTAEYFVTFMMHEPKPLSYQYEAAVILLLELLIKVSDINFLQKLENTIFLEADVFAATFLHSILNMLKKDTADITSSINFIKLIEAALKHMFKILSNMDQIYGALKNMVALMGHMAYKLNEFSGIQCPIVLAIGGIVSLLTLLLEFIKKIFGQNQIKLMIGDLEMIEIMNALEVAENSGGLNKSTKEYLTLCKSKLYGLDYSLKEIKSL